MRNLIEYTKGDADIDLSKLTSLLHWRADSDQITVADLDAIYRGLFSANGVSVDVTQSVIALIREESKKCLQAPEGINFENKVVLSIATRLAAERFMVGKLNGTADIATIESNQTTRLLRKYRQLFPEDQAAIGVLRRVALMTPENIHLNSFMYEPILDMSDDHLRKLYADVLALV